MTNPVQKVHVPYFCPPDYDSGGIDPSQLETGEQN